MIKLKLAAIPDDRPVKLTTMLPAPIHRDLVAYAELIARENGKAVEIAKLVPLMLARFMATDRVFAKAKKSQPG